MIGVYCLPLSFLFFREVFMHPFDPLFVQILQTHHHSAHSSLLFVLSELQAHQSVGWIKEVFPHHSLLLVPVVYQHQNNGFHWVKGAIADIFSQHPCYVVCVQP